jgi:hypothetical protein
MEEIDQPVGSDGFMDVDYLIREQPYLAIVLISGVQLMLVLYNEPAQRKA